MEDRDEIPTSPFSHSYDVPPPEEPPSKRRLNKRHAARALIGAGVLGVAAAGAVIGHVTWPGTTSAASLPSIDHSTHKASGAPSPGGGYYNGNFGDGGSWRITIPGFNDGGGIGQAQGSASTAQGAPPDAARIAQGISPAIVDINTDLSYQNAQAAGTGIVLTSNGEVLTNNHVIAGATRITVRDVGNGKTYTGRVVGYDKSNDVAVVQLAHASGLKTATIGDSSKVKVGDAVVGVGNAEGLGGTPSYAGGAVTGLNQHITASDGASSSERLTDMIGTNANIVPGDSGGPLVNTAGEVIGIDTAGSGSSGFVFQAPGAGNETSGYAIAINKAMSIAKKIESHTSTSTIHIGGTAFLGVSVEDVSQASNPFGGNYGSYFGNSGAQGGSSVPSSGAYVAGVVSGGPAASAGIGQGDTITAVAGHAITSPATLSSVMLKAKVGATVAVSYTDGSGQSHTVNVKLGSGPAQ
jgi:S1-C subfamily serine protease